jgi:phage major head subunit gpT-like protein
MLITPSNLNLFFTELDTRFWSAFEQQPVWHEQIATVYPAGTEQWAMGWIGMLDKLRVWKGSRVVHQPAPQTYTATIVNFELTESIDQFKLMDDTHGIYAPMISHMGEMSKKWPDYTVRDLIEASGDFASTATQLGTDGVAHWSASHPIDFYDSSKGTYVNDYGASGTSINGVTCGGTFNQNSFLTVKQDHASRKNESGEKMGGNDPNLLMVPTYLEPAAKMVLQSQFFSPATFTGMNSQTFVGAMDNPLRGSTDLMANADLSSQVAWYLLNTKRVVKPFGFVMRQAPQLTPRVSPTDPSVFDSHTYLYGVVARGVPVWSLPWLSSRSGV